MSFLRITALALIGTLPFVGCATNPGSSRGAGQVIDDSALTARVKSALAVDAGAQAAANVNVTTYRGVVQLSGFVDTERDVQRAAAVARKVEGVRSVENALRVAPSRR